MAAALALYIGLRPDLPPEGQATRYVAVLNQDGSDPGWLVTVDIARQELTIRPVAGDAERDRAPDQALELWLVASDGGPPPRSARPAGSPGRGLSRLSAVATPAEAETAVLAISLEPPGGSPTGLPTGPVVYQGKILPVAGSAIEN